MEIEEAILNVMGKVDRQQQTIDTLLQSMKLQNEIELNPVEFSYPQDGTYASLLEGQTKINWEVGTAKATTGAVTALRHSLDSEGKKWLRSLYIYTNRLITVQIENGDTFPVHPGKNLIKHNLKFRTVDIITTNTTNVSIVASTHPQLFSLYTRNLEVVEEENTATVLGASAKYAGTAFDTNGYTKIVGFAIADQDGRLEIQQSQSDFIDDVISEFDLEIAQKAIDFCYIFDDADSDAYEDETTDINDDGANDVEAPPITVNEVDILYFGQYVRFGKLYITIGTAGDYTGSTTWEYWNGTAWTNLATSHNLSDGTTNFKHAAGSVYVTWDIPTDWTEVAVNTAPTMYWVRAKGACTALTTAPLLTQAWAYPLTELPYSIDVVAKYAKAVYYNDTTAQTYFRLIANLRT